MACIFMPAESYCLFILHLTIKDGACVCMTLCSLLFSTTVNPMRSAFGGCIAGDLKKFSVEYEVVWMRNVGRYLKKKISGS